MSSWFDSEVYQLRNQIDWVAPQTMRFIKFLAQCQDQADVVLKCHYRGSVASRFWWTLSWTDDDGEDHQVSSQEIDLCMWRAIHVERIRERQRRWTERKAELEAHVAGFDDYSI
jgi:hypothetical protein